MEIPFTYGHMEDTPHINQVDKLLQKTGYIFSRRMNNESL